MPFRYLFGYFLVLLAPIITGGVLFAAFRRLQAPVVPTLLTTVAGMVVALLMTGSVVVQCSNSYDALRAADTLLTPEERETLQGSPLMCTTVYKFRRGGQETCLVTDHDGGAHVGCG